MSRLRQKYKKLKQEYDLIKKMTLSDLGIVKIHEKTPVTLKFTQIVDAYDCINEAYVDDMAIAEFSRTIKSSNLFEKTVQFNGYCKKLCYELHVLM